MEKQILDELGWLEVELTITGRVRFLPPTPRPSTDPAQTAEGGDELRPPQGLMWQRTLQPAEDFTHPWPKEGGGSVLEDYTGVASGEVKVRDKSMAVKVGRTERKGKGRLVVFLGKDIAEFVATLDGGFASLIKPDGKRVLRSDEPPPPLYHGARIESYRGATGGSGSGVPNGMALIIHSDDDTSAIHHAVARWLGKRGYPVVAGAAV